MKPREGCEPCSPSPIPHFVPQPTARPEEAADLGWSEQQTQQFPVCGHRQFGHCKPPGIPSLGWKGNAPSTAADGFCLQVWDGPTAFTCRRTDKEQPADREEVTAETDCFISILILWGGFQRLIAAWDGSTHHRDLPAYVQHPAPPAPKSCSLAALTPTKRTLCQLQPRDPLRAYAGASWSQGLMYSTQPACVLRLPATCVFHFSAVTNALFQGQGLGVEISTTC